MASFAYVAKDRSGKKSEGVIDALNLSEAANRLRQDNLFIIKLGPANAKSALTAKSGSETATKGRVSLKEKMFLAKQFYVMMHAGMGMIMCLNNLYEQTENKYLKHILNQTRTDVESGTPLSEAFAKFPKVFDKMFVYLLQAGEASGKLDNSFMRLNEDLERSYTLTKKVKGALTYPVIIVVVAVLAVIALMVFVLPTFVEMFADSGAELPTLTKVLISISDAMRKFWYLIPLTPVGIWYAYKKTRENPAGRQALDKFWLGVPVLGLLIRNLLTARFARTFASLMDSGVPLLQSMEIVENAVNNAVMQAGIHEAAVSVNRGTGLAQPLLASGIFPLMVSQMVAIGEDTGDLGRMLTEVADYYDKEVEYALESVTAMIEPLIIVGLGGVVGLIVAAIMLPMIDISTGATMGL